jgi:hypothetical protein
MAAATDSLTTSQSGRPRDRSAKYLLADGAVPIAIDRIPLRD